MSKNDIVSKVPAVTLTFWIIKILATTLGETGGDTLSMTFDWGYLLSSALFLAILVALGIAQIAAKKFRPSLYWATIIASSSFDSTVEQRSFGPILASATEVRRRHLATVFGLIPCRAASSLRLA